MALNLSKRDNYVNPYFTNWHYLQNMTSLQTSLLNQMKWNGKFISNGLWPLPDIWPSKIGSGLPMQYFITPLNNVIMGL